MNGIKTITAVLLTATTVLAGCDKANSPVEPEPVTVGETGKLQPPTRPQGRGLLTVIDALLVGHEQHDVSFVGIVPTLGDTVGLDADSLLVTTTDLLNGTTSTVTGSRVLGSWVRNSTTSSTATIQDGEKIDATGKIVTKTEKVTYSDGSTGYHTETTTSDFVAKGRKSGAECRSNETAVFQADNPGGATTFTQVAQSVVTCPGDGRQLLIHINIHFTVTPNGQVTSSVANIKVKDGSGK